MLRIAFLDSWPEDPARGSGTAAAIRGLAGGLRRAGHRVRKLAPRLRTGLLGADRLLYNALLPLELEPADFDLVVGFDLDGVLLSGRAAVPYVVALKGILADEARFETGATALRMRALSRVEGRNARRADRVLVTSRYCRDVARARYRVPADRLRVVPEGIDLAAWEGVAARRAGGRASSRRPTVLSVARQYPRKNVRTLVEAVPALRSRVPGVRVRIVGDGPELPRLRRRVERLRLGDAVELIGALAPARLREEYATADAFCLPSLQEGFGIVFLEAMAAGLPIVAGRAAAVPEVVPDGEAGLLVDPRDGAALSAALTRVLLEPGLAARLAAAGRERVRGFDWPRVAGAFVAAALGPGAGGPAAGLSGARSRTTLG